MAYETYTPARDIRTNTRKYDLHQVWNERGELAALEANAMLRKPVKEKTLTDWCRFWRWEREQELGRVG